MKTILALCCATLVGISSYQAIKADEVSLENHKNAQMALGIIEDQQGTITRQQKIINLTFPNKEVPSALFSRIVTATAYTASVEECDSTPETTASNNPSRIGTLAVSRDLEVLGLTLGKVIIVEGLGPMMIEDRMNSRWKNRIDILHANKEAAKLFAKQKRKIYWWD